MLCLQIRRVDIYSIGGHSQETGHSLVKGCIWTRYVIGILYFEPPAPHFRADQSYLWSSCVCNRREHYDLDLALFDRNRKPGRLPGHSLVRRSEQLRFLLRHHSLIPIPSLGQQRACIWSVASWEIRRAHQHRCDMLVHLCHHLPSIPLDVPCRLG